MSASNLREAFAAFIQGAFRRRRGKEIFSNKGSGFALSKPKVFLSSIKTKIKNPDLKSLGTLSRGTDHVVTEVEGVQYIGGRPKFRETLNKPAVGEIDASVISIKLNYKMINPVQTATVFIYKTGSVVISTNGPWERVVRLLARDYFPGRFHELYSGVDVTANSSRFYCNQNLNLKAITDHIEGAVKEVIPGQIRAHFYGVSGPSRKTNFQISSHVSELGFTGTVRIDTEFEGGYKVSLILGKNGTVVASCLYVDDGPRAFKKLVAEMGPTMFSGARAAPSVLKPGKEAKRAAMAEARYNLAANWSATRNGHYVRPGPDGKPRFYTIPTNKSLVRAKVIKAYSNAGVNIPSNVISKLNITAEQIATVRGRSPRAGRPSGWNNQSREGHYVRPNKQGKPQWYQIPKGKSDAKKTVIKAYSAAGINIPQHLKNLFKIKNANLNGAGGATPVVNLGKDKHLRINGKQLERYNKETLVNMAVQMNMPRVTEKMKVAEIRTEFERQLAPKVQPINVTVNGVKHTFLSNGTVRRNYANKASRTRQFATLKVAEQNAIAQAYLSANQLAEYKKKLARNKFQYLLNTKAARAIAQPPPPANRAGPSRTSPSPSNSGSPSNSNFELNLELAVRMGNLTPSPSNLQKLKTVMGKLPLGARGKPLKADVDAVWKRMTKEFKKKAQNRESAQKLTGRTTVPNWVPANKRNQFRNLLVQTALMSGKANNKKKAVQAWINSTLPKQGVPARTVENMITGEIKHIPAWNPPREFKFKIPKLSPKVKEAGAAAPKPKKSPSTKRKTIPVTNNFELLVNNMNRLGVPYNANKAYSWANLKKMGINNKYKNTWYEHVKKK